MVTAIAIHHPNPDHVAELEAHMELVRESTLERAEGLIEFECLREERGGRLLGFSRWESREAFEAALPIIAANAGRRQPEWTVAEDELLTLTAF